MSNPRFIYRTHASLERKIKENRYIPFIGLINNNRNNINNIITLKNSRGETLLHIAVKFKRINILQYLIHNFRNLKIYKNYRGETAFFYACKFGYIFIVRLFLNCSDYMSYINIKDNFNYSPLLKSYKFLHIPVANVLLEKGADWNVIASDGYVIPQIFIFNFINRDNLRFQQLSLSPLMSPSNSLSNSLSNSSDDIAGLTYEQLMEDFNLNLSTDEKDKDPLKLIKPNNEIINVIKQLYVNKNELCPITYEPLEIESTSITSCYHIFSRDAIENWFKTKNTCPVCREMCEIW